MTETRAGSLPGRPAVKLGRALASPTGVLITIPLLVVAVGVGVMLLGREATRSSSRTMAEKQLTEQASAIQGDVAFALDQASPILERLRVLADPARPLDDGRGPERLQNWSRFRGLFARRMTAGPDVVR